MVGPRAFRQLVGEPIQLRDAGSAYRWWMVRLSAWLAHGMLRLTGWSIDGSVPVSGSYIVVAYPHTSNWDFVIFLAIVHAFSLNVRFLAHQGLFKGPFGWYLRRAGGVAVDRSSPGGAVTAAVEALAASDGLALVVAPEGTRAAGSPWRSGFWRIANASGLPVVMGYVDGATRRCGLGPAVRIDGDPEAWMARARDFYADKYGLRPRRRGPMELR